MNITTQKIKAGSVGEVDDICPPLETSVHLWARMHKGSLGVHLAGGTNLVHSAQDPAHPLSGILTLWPPSSLRWLRSLLWTLSLSSVNVSPLFHNTSILSLFLFPLTHWGVAIQFLIRTQNTSESPGGHSNTYTRTRYTRTVYTQHTKCPGQVEPGVTLGRNDFLCRGVPFHLSFWLCSSCSPGLGATSYFLTFSVCSLIGLFT